MAKKDVFAVLDLAIAVVKDVALADCLRRVENAQREYLLAEADKNRGKSKAIIQAIVKIDIECKKLELTYNKVRNSLGDEGKEIMDELLEMLAKERKTLVTKKNQI